jgi:hypothetical protein
VRGSRPISSTLKRHGATDTFIAGHGVLEPGTHLLHKPFTQEILTRKVRELLDAKPDSGDKKQTDSISPPAFAGADQGTRS